MSKLAMLGCPNRGSSAFLLLLSHALQVVVSGDAEPCFNHRPACVGAAPADHTPVAGHMDAWPCAFVGMLNAPWARRRLHCYEKTRAPFSAPIARRRGRAVFCGDGQEQRPGSTTTAAGSSPAGPSSQSPAEPAGKEPPEEIQYGFWAPASKELQYRSRAPASKAKSFGGDSTIPSHVRRSLRYYLSTGIPVPSTYVCRWTSIYRELCMYAYSHGYLPRVSNEY